MSQWPEETPEQVIERTRRDHGDAMAATVAKAMGWEPAPRKTQVPRRVGRKPKLVPALNPLRDIRAGVGANLEEIIASRADDPVTLRRLITIQRMTTCGGCRARLSPGDAMGRLSNGRLVCTSCIPTLAPGRHLP